MNISNAQTIPEMFLRRVDQSADQIALLVPDQAGFRSITWQQIANDVHAAFAMLKRDGVASDDRVVLISENRYEWIVVDLAIQFAQAISVPLHSLSTRIQIRELIEDCRPALIITSDSRQRDKVGNLRDVTGAFVDEINVWQLDQIDLECPGQGHLDVGEIQSRTTLSIIYTSGTTGESKGVVLSQGNVVSNVYGKLARLKLGDSDVRWCMLPFSHIFGRTCDIYTWIAAGCVNALSRGRDHWLSELEEIRPTYINSVPYFYEKLYRIVREEGRLDDGDALRQLLGGRIRICNCGGAAIEDTVFDYYRNNGIELVTGYGLTETSPVVTSSTPTQVKKGAVGIALPDVDLKVAGDGEVLVRGPNVMSGYFENEAATRNCLHDDWFRTGDLGRIDDEGFLFLTGRKKEMIVTSGGRNIAPAVIERELNVHPAIEQSAVFGDGRDYLVVVLVLAEGDSELSVDSRIQRGLADLLRDRPAYEQVTQYVIANEPFSIENGMLTSKGSLRRHAIYEEYSHVIEQVYLRQGEGRSHAID